MLIIESWRLDLAHATLDEAKARLLLPRLAQDMETGVGLVTADSGEFESSDEEQSGEPD